MFVRNRTFATYGEIHVYREKEVCMMLSDKYFALFEEKYGEDFNWMRTSSESFVDELRHELGDECSFNSITVIAKCESNDDVLFLIDGIYRIYHLTYSRNVDSIKYLEFNSLSEAMDYIEKDFKVN